MTQYIAVAGAQAMLDALLALLDDTGAATIKIYDDNASGAAVPPLTTAISTETLLGTLTMTAPGAGPGGTGAFLAAVDANPNATATANPITGDTAADATGSGVFFRAASGLGVDVIQGAVGLTGSVDGEWLLITSTDDGSGFPEITAGQPITVSSLVVTQPESG